MSNPGTPASRQTTRETVRPEGRPTERKFRRPTNRGLTAGGGEIDQSRVPEGYVMEWKRHKILGATDTRNIAEVLQYGWQPVPHKLQPHILGPTCKDEDLHITRGGGTDGLYMRPAYLNEEAQEEHDQETEDVLRNQLQSLKQESSAQVGGQRTYVKKKTVAVPADTN